MGMSVCGPHPHTVAWPGDWCFSVMTHCAPTTNPRVSARKAANSRPHNNKQLPLPTWYVNTLREKWVTVTANVYQQLAVTLVFVHKRYCDGIQQRL